MLTRFLHNSPQLCALFDRLNLELYQPQRRHILNMADALLVCDEKTIAALQREFVEAPDASNMADFLRISPWQANEVRAALRAHQVTWLIEKAERQEPQNHLHQHRHSLGEKDKDTLHLEPVDWHFDHAKAPEANHVSRIHSALWSVPASWSKLATVALQFICGKDSASAQLETTQRRAHSVSQQIPHRPSDPGSLATALTRRLASVCAIRQLVRFQKTDQVCPPPTMAPHLWAQVHRNSTATLDKHARLQAPVVDASA